MNKPLSSGYLLIVLLQALDLLTTLVCLTIPNTYETNLLANYILQTTGVLGMILFKCLIIIILLLLLRQALLLDRRLFFILIFIHTLIMLPVVINNLSIIF